MTKEINVDRIPAEAMEKIRAKMEARRPVIDNTELVLGFRKEGGSIMHVRPHGAFPEGTTRGLTVAFKKKGGRIEIATAVQHRADDFTKKIGTKTAIDHFRAGKTVTLPVRGDYPMQQLQNALRFLV